MISGSRYTQINNKGKNIYAFHANEKLYTIMEQLYEHNQKGINSMEDALVCCMTQPSKLQWWVWTVQNEKNNKSIMEQ